MVKSMNKSVEQWRLNIEHISALKLFFDANISQETQSSTVHSDLLSHQCQKSNSLTVSIITSSLFQSQQWSHIHIITITSHVNE